MNVEELKKERIALFKKAMRKDGAPKRVPHLSNIYTWKVSQSEYSLSEATHDWDIMLKIQSDFNKKYIIDAAQDIGIRNPLNMTEILGNIEYTVNDEICSISIRDQCIMTEDEYPQLIADPWKYIWEVFIPRKNPKLLEKNSAYYLRESLKEFAAFGEYSKKVMASFAEDGIPPLVSCDFTCEPFGGYELLFNLFRGIKGVSIDLRRHKQEVREAIDVLDSITNYPLMDNYTDDKAGTTPNACFDCMVPMLGHTVLNSKQFEEFYWPYFKKMSDFAVKYDKIIYVFTEGDGTPFLDFFAEFPKGHFGVHCEQTDIFNQYKHCPNIANIGGMPFTLLATGTPEECVDRVKYLLDFFSEGGYIFSEEKMVSFPNECRPDTFAAVCDYLNTYWK